MAMKCIFICIIGNYVLKSEAARILAVFPTPSISHQVVFRPLVQELAKRGHEVVVVTTDPVFPKDQAPANLTEIDVHDISYKAWRENFLKTATGKKDDLFSQTKVGTSVLTTVFEKQLETEEFQNAIRDGPYDLLMVEAVVRPAVGISHVLKAPMIQVSSFTAPFYNFELIGAPVHPLLYPSYIRQKINNLSLWDKISELYTNYRIKRILDEHEEEENAMLRRCFGPKIPLIRELVNNVDMLFLNVHPVWEGNRPVPPSVIYMGGMHQKPQKELPKDLQIYLDSSKHGVIYISFGTNVSPSLLPPEKIQVFVKVFSQLPYDVLWKWDKDELPGKTSNIKISKWLPQSDLLRHPNLKLFITQGGLQSTDEALTAGVPLIGIPMVGDQWFNVENYVKHRIGRRLDIEALSEEALTEAITDVIQNESYRKNTVKLREIMRDEQTSPLSRAVWWTEYVIRHQGAKHLRSPAANISWSQYLELDLVLTLLSMFLVTMVLIFIIVLKLCKYLMNNYLRVKLKSN